MGTQLQINFFNGDTLLLDKDFLNGINDKSFKESSIRKKISLDTNYLEESLVLYVPNREDPIEEYDDENILFCLVKPIVKFQTKTYNYTEIRSKKGITLDQL